MLSVVIAYEVVRRYQRRLEQRDVVAALAGRASRELAEEARA